MPGGRPTKYLPEFCDVAIKTLSEGLSKEALAGELGIAKQTLYDWIELHQEFSDAIKKGETAGQAMWERLGLAGAQGNVDGFNAASWVFNMKNRFGWRDRQEHFGADGGPIVVNVVRHADD